MLIVPPAHELAARASLALSEIARHPLLMPDRASSTRRVIEQAFSDRGLEIQVAMELERWHVIREFVALEQGIAIVPRFSVAGDERRVAVRRVQPAFPLQSYGIIRRTGRHLPPIARGLIDALREHAARASNEPWTQSQFHSVSP